MAIPDAKSPREGRNHQWWPPGWRRGHRFYACHFTLEDQPALRNLVGHYQDAVAHMAALDLVPARWLHLTMQDIGFADRIGPAELTEVTQQLRRRLARFPAPTVRFRWPTIRPGAVVLLAYPREPLYQLRLAIHDAITAVLPPPIFAEPRPKRADFAPQVSFARIKTEGPVEPIADALLEANPPVPVTVTFRAASLLRLQRDPSTDRWSQATPVALGPAVTG